ncbi:MAG: cytidylate kinase-like family protein [Bacteroidales bacterium]|nr:cytidylate kinase-like family protein [Bacteroidales bacterium]
MENQEVYTDTYYRNVFEEYFNQALHQNTEYIVETGPYVSISRDFGCRANVIAQKLSKELTRRCFYKNINHEWKWLNKSILIESSKALEISPSKIQYVFRSKKKTMMDDIVGAMSTRYYKSDRKIRNTILDVLRSIARSGHVIIVGRGGVAFAKDNPDSLHIKLTAPIEWRVDHISKNYNKSRGEALQYVQDVDQERKYLIDSFIGHDSDHSIFDLVFNRKTMKEEEIISIILNLMQSRKLIR